MRLFCYILTASVLGCIISQLLKMFFNFVIDGKNISLRGITSDGDYPSSHTSFITCTTTIAWLNTLNKYLQVGEAEIEMWVAISFTALMVVIIRDALGVRLTVQKLCENVIRIVDSDNMIDKKISEEIKNALNIKSGHKPHEVVGGAIVGILISIAASAIYYRWFICFAIDSILFIFYVIISIIILKKKRAAKKNQSN